VSLERDWPLFGLWIKTPRLTLEYPDDSDLDLLNELASQGIHDPDVMPFDVPWTDEPPTLRPQHSLQFYWGLRASWKPTAWHLTMMIKDRGAVVGAQGMFATDFAIKRQVGTGSWVGKSYQRQGIGKEMRAAILHLAFAGLGAERATSAAFENNAASIGVSRALGYVENGDDIGAPRGKPMRQIRWLLTRQAWEQRRRGDIELHGLEPCLPMFGVETPSPALPASGSENER
jgi:RimJ/RimL family protein N-acetyltransferase